MRAQPKDITIVGGGLAGLTLGIGLRGRGVPVVIWEAGRYRRHRVCGEFISGNGLETLRKLGCLETLEKMGARAAQTAIFFAANHRTPIRDLPEPALCISRFQLDGWLATRFCELGGELRCGARWTNRSWSEGVVRASGRRAKAKERGWRWYGLKAHARNVKLSADLEMHLSARGYVGLCRLPADTVNVCGLFRRRTTDPNPPENPVERFSSGVAGELVERLRHAEWDENSFCAVGGLSYGGCFLGKEGECAVGDALVMTPPVTGNGMSMAFESADLALDPLVDYAQGRLNWIDACARLRANCRERFARRIRCARTLQAALFLAPLRTYLWPVVGRTESLWRLFFRATR